MPIQLFKDSTSALPFAASTIIFHEDDAPGGVMYVVVEGEVDIAVHGKVIDTIGVGASLGEIGLVDKQPRTASASTPASGRRVASRRQCEASARALESAK